MFCSDGLPFIVGNNVSVIVVVYFRAVAVRLLLSATGQWRYPLFALLSFMSLLN